MERKAGSWRTWGGEGEESPSLLFLRLGLFKRANALYRHATQYKLPNGPRPLMAKIPLNALTALLHLFCHTSRFVCYFFGEEAIIEHD